MQHQPQAWLEFFLRITNFLSNAQEIITTLENDKAIAQSSLEQANATMTENAITMAAGQAVIDELRTNLADVSSLSNRSHRSTKHPDPSPFGGDKAELRGGMTQLRIKLNINKDYYPTEQSKLAYTLSRLKEKALDQLQPYLERDGNIALANMDAFYIKLQLAFRDPDRKATAQRELRQLR